MNNPLVSIIVPCYNQSDYLDEALQSVLYQTYKNWECIIVNDGSPDDTETTAKKWCQKDNRFNYVFQENGGLSSARNLGLNVASGDYIQFLDSDDVLDPRKLELSLFECNKEPEKSKRIVISNFKRFTNNIKDSLNPSFVLSYELFTFKNILFKWDSIFVIPIHCGLFQACVFNSFRFPVELKAKEDWIMWLYLFQEEPTVYFIDKHLVYYRLHQNSMTKDFNHMRVNYFNAVEFLGNFIAVKDYNEYLIFSLKKNYNSTREFKMKFQNLKHSNSFKLGFKVKQILAKMGLRTLCVWGIKKLKK